MILTFEESLHRDFQLVEKVSGFDKGLYLVNTSRPRPRWTRPLAISGTLVEIDADVSAAGAVVNRSGGIGGYSVWSLPTCPANARGL